MAVRCLHQGADPTALNNAKQSAADLAAGDEQLHTLLARARQHAIATSPELIDSAATSGTVGPVMEGTMEQQVPYAGFRPRWLAIESGTFMLREHGPGMSSAYAVLLPNPCRIVLRHAVHL